tara:strand:- start:1042 stop:1365 length:324 start_codon:yes stop_codon:yes gene_type:complete
MGGNNTKPEYKFGSYQRGTRPGYHVTSEHVFYTGMVLKNVDPKKFKKLGAGWAKTDQKLFYKGKHLKGADPNTFEFLETGYVIDDNIKKDYPKGVKSKAYRALYNSK